MSGNVCFILFYHFLNNDSTGWNLVKDPQWFHHSWSPGLPSHAVLSQCVTDKLEHCGSWGPLHFHPIPSTWWACCAYCPPPAWVRTRFGPWSLDYSPPLRMTTRDWVNTLRGQTGHVAGVTSHTHTHTFFGDLGTWNPECEQAWITLLLLPLPWAPGKLASLGR